jgi:hypothetical protein
MHPLKTFIYLFVAPCLFFSCAASYKPIEPSRLNYTRYSDTSNFSYKYDVLILSGNRKFAKKEFLTQIRIVAVKITNNTGRPLKYGVNYNIYSGNKMADILPVPEITNHIRETVPTYLLYLLFTPTKLTVSTQTSQSSFPIGLILGPALTGINVGTAASANKHFKMELEEYDILDREIKVGETVYGLIGVQLEGFDPLYLKMKDD